MGNRRAREITEGNREATVKEDEEEDDDESADETITIHEVAEHPAMTSITGVYKIVAMGVVSVSTLKMAKANEYEIRICREGLLGLQLVRCCHYCWRDLQSTSISNLAFICFVM